VAKSVDAKDRVKKELRSDAARQANEPHCGYGVMLESKLRAALEPGCSGRSMQLTYYRQKPCRVKSFENFALPERYSHKSDKNGAVGPETP
jgi:hypothetical protein